MATIRQIQANRRNAQKSTGPVSAAGKAASSMNALKTGIHAKSILLPTESLAELEQLIDDYYTSHRPATPEARALVDDLIYGDWIKRRLRVAEAQLWQYDHQECYRPDDDFPLGQTVANRSKVFAHLQWRTECNRRATRQAAQELAQLEAQAAPEPRPTPNTPIHFTPNWLRSKSRARPRSHPARSGPWDDGPSQCAACPSNWFSAGANLLN